MATESKPKYTFRQWQEVYWHDSERGRNWRVRIMEQKYGRSSITIQDRDWPCKRRAITVSTGNLIPFEA